MVLLNVNSITKNFGARTIFNNVSFNLSEGDKAGFVGVNGAGKSTFFKILTGEIMPDGGEIFINKLAKIGYAEQNAEITSNCTLIEEVMKVFTNIMDIEKELESIYNCLEVSTDESLIKRQHLLGEQFKNLGGYTYKSRLRATLLGLSFKEEDFGLPMLSLSGGQRTRALLAKILLSESNLLLLDEPTNHLDIDSVSWLEEFLRSYKGAAIIISHDRYFLDRVTNRTFELENTTFTVYKGGYSRFISQKEERIKSAERQYENTMREIGRIEGIITQQKQWNREKNIKTAESKQKQIDRLKKDMITPENTPQTMNFRFGCSPSGANEVLKAEGICKEYPGKKLLQNVDLFIKKGERVFILGPNGCGKTTLLNILLSRTRADSGRIIHGSGVIPKYYEQTQENIALEKTVFDEISDTYPEMSQTSVRSALASFLFKGDDVFKEIMKLSGGERAKINLLKIMLSGANFLVLDEPTNHLDINSRETLEKALLSYDGTILCVSHDRYFVNKLCDRLYYIDSKGCRSVEGNYDSYLSLMESKALAQPIRKESFGAVDYRTKKERESRIRQNKNRIILLEEEMENLDNKIASLKQKQICDDVATDYKMALEIAEEIESCRQKADQLFCEWEECNLELEKLSSIE